VAEILQTHKESIVKKKSHVAQPQSCDKVQLVRPAVTGAPSTEVEILQTGYLNRLPVHIGQSPEKGTRIRIEGVDAAILKVADK
jgi:hypothetical protein